MLNGSRNAFVWMVIALTACFLATYGCKFDMHPIPYNADPRQKQAVQALKPMTENISWNASGKVRTLYVTGDNVDDKALAYVGQLVDLEELGVHGPITNSGLQYLEKLKRLRGLSLSWTAISDDGLVHLSMLSDLWVLDLGGTKITDDGLKHLAKLKNLTRLYIENTTVTDAGAAEFRSTLPQCSVQR